MRVKMKVQLSGARNGELWPEPGGVIDLPDDEAANLCGSGVAEPVVADVVESAVPAADDVETAVADDVELSEPPADEQRADEVKRPNKAASREKWQEYAEHLGMPDEEAADATRAALIEFVENAEA